jgi:methylmalonyl-CoA mutase
MIDISTDTPSLLAGDFPQLDEARWRALVDKVLKGADFERRLVTTTADGIRIRPLYTAADGPFLPGLPGSSPCLRGASASGSALAGWDVRALYQAGDAADTNRTILEELENGVTSIQLRLDRPGTVDGLARMLEGVLLDVAAVGLEAGDAFAAAAGQLLALAKELRVDPATMRAQLNADPLGAAVVGDTRDPAGLIRQAVDLAWDTAGPWPQVTTLLADGRLYHGGGASDAQEVAFTVATAIGYLRAMSDGGLPSEAAARQIAFALAADSDFFLTVVKFRVLRRLWSRVLEVVGAEAAMPAMRVHAETASRMLTRLDPQVNILRGTVAAFAAAAGGAASITVLPFDHALGAASPLARRIARNTQLVLLEESNVGRVIDPAGGSWLVERLSEELAEKAWSLVQEIERRGGMAAALREGWPQAMVAASRERLEREVATRRAPVTGVSEFSNPDEQLPPPPDAIAGLADGPIRPIPAYRLAEPFERVHARGDAALVATGKRPSLFLATLGSRTQFAGREGFARSLFEAGGFATASGGQLAGDEIATAFAASGAGQAAICSSDTVYAEEAEAAARALRAAGARGIYLMGRPSDAQQAAWSAAGVDEFVFAGCDVLAVLERAHSREIGEGV